MKKIILLIFVLMFIPFVEAQCGQVHNDVLLNEDLVCEETILLYDDLVYDCDGNTISFNFASHPSNTAYYGFRILSNSTLKNCILTGLENIDGSLLLTGDNIEIKNLIINGSYLDNHNLISINSIANSIKLINISGQSDADHSVGLRIPGINHFLNNISLNIPNSLRGLYIGQNSNNISINKINITSNQGIYVSNSNNIIIQNSFFNTNDYNAIIDYNEINGINNTLINNTFINTNSNLLSPYYFLIRSYDSGLLKNNNFITNGYLFVLDNSFLPGGSTNKLDIVYENDYGEILWKDKNENKKEFNQDMTFPGSINYSFNNITINSALGNELGSAQIQIKRISYSQTPWLLKDGVRCDNTSECNITYYSNNYTLVANVSSVGYFTTYLEGEEPSEMDPLQIPPTVPTSLIVPEEVFVGETITALASGSTSDNEIIYYYEFYNLNDEQIVQIYSTNNSYVTQQSDEENTIIIRTKAFSNDLYSDEITNSTLVLLIPQAPTTSSTTTTTIPEVTSSSTTTTTIPEVTTSSTTTTTTTTTIKSSGGGYTVTTSTTVIPITTTSTTTTSTTTTTLAPTTTSLIPVTTTIRHTGGSYYDEDWNKTFEENKLIIEEIDMSETNIEQNDNIIEKSNELKKVVLEIPSSVLNNFKNNQFIYVLLILIVSIIMFAIFFVKVPSHNNFNYINTIHDDISLHEIDIKLNKYEELDSRLDKYIEQMSDDEFEPGELDDLLDEIL
jgi:hypothetical protein